MALFTCIIFIIFFKILVKLRFVLTLLKLVLTQMKLVILFTIGNSWGVDPVTKRGCIGCGAQEEFYGCADIGIRTRGGGAGIVTPGPQPIPTTTKPPVTTRRIIRYDDEH